MQMLFFPYKMTFIGSKDWDLKCLWVIIQLIIAIVSKTEMLPVQG